MNKEDELALGKQYTHNLNTSLRQDGIGEMWPPKSHISSSGNLQNKVECCC